MIGSPAASSGSPPAAAASIATARTSPAIHAPWRAIASATCIEGNRQPVPGGHHEPGVGGPVDDEVGRRQGLAGDHDGARCQCGGDLLGGQGGDRCRHLGHAGAEARPEGAVVGLGADVGECRLVLGGHDGSDIELLHQQRGMVGGSGPDRRIVADHHEPRQRLTGADRLGNSKAATQSDDTADDRHRLLQFHVDQ